MIAVAVLGDQAAAYFCDGRTIESWLRGDVEGSISRCGAGGATVQAGLDGDHLKGTLKIKNERLKFEIDEAKKPAGLYRARGSKTTIGWIVLEDGSQVGIQTAGADSAAAQNSIPRVRRSPPTARTSTPSRSMATKICEQRRFHERASLFLLLRPPAAESQSGTEDRPSSNRLCRRQCGLYWIGVYGRLHTPTGYADNIAGFSQRPSRQSVPRQMVMALAIVQTVRPGYLWTDSLAWRVGGRVVSH